MELGEDFEQRLRRLGGATLEALRAHEAAWRRLHPPQLPSLRETLAPRRERLAEALEGWRTLTPPAEVAPFHAQLAAGAEHAEASLALFCTETGGAGPILESASRNARALEVLYPLRLALPPLADHFVEPAYRGLRDFDPEPPEGVSVGLHRGGGEGPEGRGGFCLYVPEWYDGSEDWPLVVALHGGSGAGRDFLFSWLREARGRGCLLLAPSSRGPTWSLDAPGIDGAALLSMLAFVGERWRVDPKRVLLTGLSDGATMALLMGLAEGSPFTHLAPVSGVLHPANFALGNLARAKDRPVYLVHGALDWLFPVSLAQMARDALAEAGAALCYREIEDLSHTYPREENAAILDWLG